MEISYRDDKFCCWGSESQGGTYLLRLTVSQPLAVRFGRFQSGRLIDVPSGDYLYAGSALAQKGPTSLARRLLRHASRSDPQSSHAIRAAMLQLFPQLALGPIPLQSPTAKKLRWHVDFLLDEAAVDLTAVYLIRHTKKSLTQRNRSAERKLETAVARWLTTLPDISPLVAGLGATDDPGETHLLRVTAVLDWWQTFPQHLTAFLQASTEANVF